MTLDKLEPKSVLRFFEELCSIPHGSGNTKAVSDWCVRFAEERGLEHYQDALNNVIIIKPAYPGYEGAEPMIIQGHLDMVCAKRPDCAKDMAREGLDIALDGDWIYAEGTTLGGDDGAAVAIGLALLDASDLPHPRLEVIFTVDEETGMDGAMGLDVSPIRGRTMLNLDSEEEGVFTVGCAGGARACCTIDLERGEAELVPVELNIGGLAGGHSGVEIDKGRANANILMGRLLRKLSRLADIRIVSAGGGTADNAIAPSCSAVIGIQPQGVDALLSVVESVNAAFAKEFRAGDGGVTVTASIGEAKALDAVDAKGTKSIVTALTLFPNGVQAMSMDIPGLVETSLNLGRLSIDGDRAVFTFSVRSSVPSRKEKLMDKLECIMEAVGGRVEFSGQYPAWEYRAQSAFRNRAVEVYERLYGEGPRVLTIHAGLECGLFCEKLPGLDCISIGPNMRDIHTPGERLSVSSLRRVWEFVCLLLKESR